MAKLFGTDGIRGLANQYPITAEMALRIGRSVAFLIGREKDGEKVKIIIGKDTRISGTMLEYAVAAGVCSIGADASLTGVLPTPGVAHLAKNLNADAGIVISASHNPYFDNGIKIFNGKGFKFSSDIEDQIEELVLDHKSVSTVDSLQEIGSIYLLKGAVRKYADFLKSITPFNFSLKGLKIVVDCANGATFQTAPLVFTELGGDVITLFSDPDGININQECGSQHPELH
jgi:phosphoglucosamine mutase